MREQKFPREMRSCIMPAAREREDESATREQEGGRRERQVGRRQMKIEAGKGGKRQYAQ